MAPPGALYGRNILARWVLIACACLLLLLAQGCASADRTIMVMSYNIHHGEGTDGVIDLERIAAVIRAAEPDLVALQEVDLGTSRSGGVDQAARLGELTGMQVVFGEAMPYDGGSYGEAVLSRLPITGHRIIPLPFSPGHEPRCALAVNVRLGNEIITFIGTHLDHTSVETDRLRQAGALVAEYLGPHGTYARVILAGDLNATPGSPPLRALQRGGWLEATNPSAPTWPSGMPRRHIDYVLYRPAAFWTVIGSRVIQEPLASDHCPVLAEIRRDAAFFVHRNEVPVLGIDQN